MTLQLNKFCTKKQLRGIKHIPFDGMSTTLNEIYQETSMSFALCNVDIDKSTCEEIHQKVTCRDYMIDIVTFNKKSFTTGINIYGMHYGSKDKQLTDIVGIVVKCENVNKSCIFNTREFFKQASILTKLEKNNHMRPSIFTKLNLNSAFVIPNPLWLTSTFSLSLFTFLIKCISYKYTTKVYTFKDIFNRLKIDHYGEYIRFSNVLDIVTEHIFNNLLNILRKTQVHLAFAAHLNFSDYNNLHNLHNYSGFKTILDQYKTQKEGYLFKLDKINAALSI